MKNTSKTFKKTFSLVIALMMLFNMALITSAAKSVDADLRWTADYENGTWEPADGSTKIFSAENFEPGSEIIRYFKISNTGSAAFKYDFKFTGAADELADVIDVYYSANVSENVAVEDMGDSIGTLSSVVGGDVISSEKILPNGLESEGYYTDEIVIAVALKMKNDAKPSYMGKNIGDGFYVSLNVTKDEDYTGYPLVDKFEVKLPKANFLYRVGNMNTVALGSLFKAIDGAEIENVTATVEAINNSNVGYTYTPNSDWTKGTIQFTGTGPAKVTIVDDDYSKPVELIVEVIDATNYISAADVKSGDVVLLNDISGTFTVSGGNTLYGNGFKISCLGDGSYKSAALSYGFITVSDGGTIDNVKIVCNIFPKSYLYTSEMEKDSSGRYPYGYSAVVITGNSTISNSYIYGARNNIAVGNGNVLIKNTVTECGSLSNIQIKSDNSYTVTLDNVTTIQYQTKSSYDTSVNMLGFGIAVGDNESASNPTINIKGDLRQYNWVTSADTSVNNTYAQTAIKEALKATTYQHTINNTTAVNMGIVYLNSADAVINDERTNKDTIKYVLNNITMSGQTGQVYSISGSDINADSRYDAAVDGVIPYSPSENGVIKPVVVFTGTQSDSLSFENKYDSTEGKFINKLKVDLDNISGGTYNFSFNSIKVQKCGVDLPFTVKDSEGNTISKDTVITLNQLFTGEYILNITDNQILNSDGILTGDSVEHSYLFIVNATKTSIDPPKFTGVGNGTAIRLYESSWGTEYWRPAYTALEGVTVSYWSKSEGKTKTLDLSSLNTSGTISSNVWKYTCDDYTLTITGGTVHSDGSLIKPKVVSGKLYFASMDKNFKTATTSRSIILTYKFEDTNASTPESLNKTVNYSNLTAYNYSDFSNGNLVEKGSSSDSGSSGGGCVTGDTLVTLADGSQKRMDAVTTEDMLLVWDFYKGDYAVVSPAIIFNHGIGNNNVIKLKFNDGTELKVINLHQLYDVASNKFVNVTVETVDALKGRKFAKMDGESYKYVELTDYEISEEEIEAYGIISAEHYNIITEGLLTTDFEAQDYGLFNYFEIGNDLTFDAEKMDSDIKEYGVYTYDDFEGYLTNELFDLFNVKYMKVAVGKGQYTYEGILGLIEKWIVNSDETILPGNETEVIPTAFAETDDVKTTKDITSGLNTITAANFSFDVTLENAEEVEGGYVINDNNAVITLKANDASGYAIITVDDDKYYTSVIKKDDTMNIAIKNAKGQPVAIDAFWGTHSNNVISDNTIIAEAFAFAVELTNAEEVEGGYAVTDNNAVIKLTAKGASKGYAIFTVDGDTYYTAAIENGNSEEITIKNAKGQTVEIEALWGTHEKTTIVDNTIDLGSFSVKATNPTDKGAEAVIANTTKYDRVDVNVYIAVYNKDTNRLVAVNTEKVTVKGNSEYTITVDAAMPANYEIKAFMWDADLKPVK